MKCGVRIAVISTLIVLTRAGLPCHYTLAHLNVHNISSLKSLLGREVSGIVAAPWDDQYEKFRAIHNRACCQKPLLIVRPRSRKDVSKCVLFSQKNRLPLSVRSGGHSYICTSLKHEGLHLDLRDLNTVQLRKTRRSPTGLAAILGPGSDWRRVLSFIPADKYTVIHGQCLEVGVGGFILGGGINALGATVRHGWAAENVLQMKMVLADGSYATVNKDFVSIKRLNGKREKIHFSSENDLWFALRGAGTSFGIVTEFLYTVYKRPETFPVLIPIDLSSLEDFRNIENAAANTKKYLITCYSTRRYFDGVFPYNLLPYNLPYSMKIGGKHFVLLNKLQGLLGMTSTTPFVLITVTQVEGASGRFTDPIPVINYLKHHKVKLGFEIPQFINLLTSLAGYLTVGNYEDGFLTLKEQQILGNLNIASAAMYGMKNSQGFGNIFLNHPLFGQNSKLSPEKVKAKTGCDFCWFSFNFDNHLRFRNYSRVAISPEFGVFQWDFSCLFRNTNSGCPKAVRDLKRSLSLDRSIPKISQFQYGNTPSCEDIDFGSRYWGSHYPRLTRIKKIWDPSNVFNHCHSVGSTEQFCCPY